MVPWWVAVLALAFGVGVGPAVWDAVARAWYEAEGWIVGLLCAAGLVSIGWLVVTRHPWT